MPFESAMTTEELFDLLAEEARVMVREELAKGCTTADLVVLIADYDDRFATAFMEYLGLGPGDADEELSDGDCRIGCAITDRTVVDALVSSMPDLAGPLSLPVGDGEVMTVVISGGIAEVFHLFMEPRVEAVPDDPMSDVTLRADGLFDAWKDKLADMALKFLVEGKDLHEIVGLIFDLGHQQSREVVSSLMPDLDLEQVAPTGEAMIGCGMADRGAADLLASAASGLAEVIRQPVPQGAILTLVVASGHITAYHLFMTVLSGPDELLN